MKHELVKGKAPVTGIILELTVSEARNLYRLIEYGLSANGFTSTPESYGFKQAIERIEKGY